MFVCFGFMPIPCMINVYIIGRILSSSKDKGVCEDQNGASLNGDPPKENESKVAHLSQFLPTSRRIVQFSNGKVIFFPFPFHRFYCSM